MNGRRHTRAKLERKCHIVGKDGKEYPAALVDISFSGASITVAAGAAAAFKTGDVCDLLLSLKSAEQPIKRTCEIIRLDSNIIGVEFLT